MIHVLLITGLSVTSIAANTAALANMLRPTGRARTQARLEAEEIEHLTNRCRAALAA